MGGAGHRGGPGRSGGSVVDRALRGHAGGVERAGQAHTCRPSPLGFIGLPAHATLGLRLRREGEGRMGHNRDRRVRRSVPAVGDQLHRGRARPFRTTTMESPGYVQPAGAGRDAGAVRQLEEQRAGWNPAGWRGTTGADGSRRASAVGRKIDLGGADGPAHSGAGRAGSTFRFEPGTQSRAIGAATADDGVFAWKRAGRQRHVAAGPRALHLPCALAERKRGVVLTRTNGGCFRLAFVPARPLGRSGGAGSGRERRRAERLGGAVARAAGVERGKVLSTGVQSGALHPAGASAVVPAGPAGRPVGPSVGRRPDHRHPAAAQPRRAVDGECHRRPLGRGRLGRIAEPRPAQPADPVGAVRALSATGVERTFPARGSAR